MREGWVIGVDAREIGARTGLMVLVCSMIPCSETLILSVTTKDQRLPVYPM